tara:strand:- start:305 stop:496 length:192 start_codon:yes stop_codon:yes gene_type:complete
MTLKLSNQAIGAIMMALQKGILDQEDITVLLQDFNLIEGEEGLVVENPPSFKLGETLETEAGA